MPTGRQIRAARALAGLRCGELADLASVHISAVLRAEAGAMTAGDAAALAAIQRALESCGIELGPDDWVRYRHSDAAAPEPPRPVDTEAPGPRQLRAALRPGQRLSRELGAACRRARDALGLTQQGASERIGVSAEYYARIERSVAVPSTETFVRIAQVFALDLDKLIHEGVGVTNARFQRPVRPYQEFPREPFGILCRKARKAQELTQHEVSRRVGVSANFYSRIERGSIVPSLPLLWLLVRVLQLPIHTLLQRPVSPTQDSGG